MGEFQRARKVTGSISELGCPEQSVDEGNRTAHMDHPLQLTTRFIPLEPGQGGKNSVKVAGEGL